MLDFKWQVRCRPTNPNLALDDHHSFHMTRWGANRECRTMNSIASADLPGYEIEYYVTQA